MVPLVDNVCNFTLVDDPTLIGKLAGNRDSNFVVVAVWARTFSIVILDTMTGRDTNWMVMPYP
jgi:hypothetical protein